MNCKGELYHCQQDEMGKAGYEVEVEIVPAEILTAQFPILAGDIGQWKSTISGCT